jgi:hypothetical protein
MTTQKSTSIKIGDFILRNDSVLEYPDGSLIDLKKAVVANIGIMPEDDLWVVTLLTKAAIYRLQMNTKDSLEVIGFKFDNFNDALTMHSILCHKLFDIKPNKEIDEKDNE